MRIGIRAIAFFVTLSGTADSNHRYTTDPAIKAAMIAKGYVPEGYGADQTAMCALVR